MWQRWFQRTRKPVTTKTRAGKRTRLTGWEVLEDRTVPSAPTIAITDGVSVPPAGALDLTFGGGDGIVTGFAEPFLSRIEALQVLPDGRILGVGTRAAENNSRGDFALFVLDADGVPDPNFGSDGVATANFDGFLSFGVRTALAPDGKIVAVGATGPEGPDFDRMALARFHADGTLDDTFDSDGRVVLDLAEGVDVALDLVVQPDGKVVAVGRTNSTPGSSGDWAIARFNVNGSLDPSFGDGDGIAIVDFGTSGATAASVLLQPDDKIVVLGHADAVDGSLPTHFAAVRFTAEGTLDPTFGEGGKFLFDPGGNRELATIHDAVLLPDGRIVAVGWTLEFGVQFEQNVALLRLLPNGTLDPTFGDGGTAFGNLGTSNSAARVAVTDDGQIVVGGDRFVARYNADGSLDHSFGTSGPGFTLANDYVDGVGWGFAVQPNGDALFAGLKGESAVVLRFLGEPSGLRTTINEGAEVTVTGTFVDLDEDTVTITASSGAITQTGTHTGTWSWSLIPSDGPDDTRLVTVTATDSEGTSASVMFGLEVKDVTPTVAIVNDVGPLPAGALDVSFGDDGIATALGPSQVNALELLPDGRILGGGFLSPGLLGSDFALYVFNPDGTPDSNFNSGGVATADFDGATDWIQGLALAPDGAMSPQAAPVLPPHGMRSSQPALSLTERLPWRASILMAASTRVSTALAGWRSI